ncbi:MAG TPA: hypothetical protein QF753_15120 [Victivallales bacterium]|nr:hypothetical protein [Victivallales bacterium]
MKLQSFFVKNNGELYYKGRKHCVKNNLGDSNIYNFDKYSIVVEPIDWTENAYEVFIFIGHIKNIKNLRKNELFSIDNSVSTRSFANSNDLKKYFKTNKIGFKGFYLGSHIDKQDLLKIEKSTDNISTINESKDHDKYIFIYGKTDGIFFQLEYLNGYLIWMHFLSME